MGWEVDTSSERERVNAELMLRRAHGVVLVFNVLDLVNVAEQLAWFRQVAPQNYPLFLVGTLFTPMKSCHLVGAQLPETQRPEPNYCKMVELADAHGAEYIEVALREGHPIEDTNIDRVFAVAAARALLACTESEARVRDRIPLHPLECSCPTCEH